MLVHVDGRAENKERAQLTVLCRNFSARSRVPVMTVVSAIDEPHATRAEV